jgi:signal transduction histidine kinase
MLRTSTNHLLHLVNDVLDYSKIEADKLELEKSAFNMRKVAKFESLVGDL